MEIANVANGASVWNLSNTTKCAAMTVLKTSFSARMNRRSGTIWKRGKAANGNFHHKPFIFFRITKLNRKG